MMLKVTRQMISSGKHLPAIGLFQNVYSGASSQLRHKSKTYIPRPKPLPNIKYQAMAQSLKAKGYLRPQNPYQPPTGVQNIVDELKTASKLKTGYNGTTFNLEDKFNFLSICAKEFNHPVPSSLLHEINTINDVVNFYITPVNTHLPLDELTTRELPPNLHIEHNYTRFHPDTDTMFGGKSAFPESSTIVTGIKSRKKYPGFVAERKREELHEDWKP